MTETINLSSQIQKQLPAELADFMEKASDIAQIQSQKLYLVGGVVRDLLLGKKIFDSDLVIEGNAIELAQRLNSYYEGKITTHSQFGTAKLQWGKWSIDLTTARSETYAKPGALPEVRADSIKDDLFRRDFTINAMAISLVQGQYGELIDLYGGKDDLKHKSIRILHENSFIDDATRIWRALRYEQRLDFQIEKSTLRLLKRDVPLLDTISGDRIRYELECVLREKFPEKTICRADELEILAKLHPSLKGNGWLAEKFERIRRTSPPNAQTTELYLALLIYRMPPTDVEYLISHLRPPKPLTQTLRHTVSLKAKLETLATPGLVPSSIYRLLRGYSPAAITVNAIACVSPIAAEHLQLFLSKLRYTNPTLTGNDLQDTGIPRGPKIKRILGLLHEARLDGKVSDKKEEVELVQRWLHKPNRNQTQGAID